MAPDAITIPKEEYDLLVKCRQIVESEFEERFSPEFIECVRKSEEAYKKGQFVHVKNFQERKKLFDSL